MLFEFIYTHQENTHQENTHQENTHQENTHQEKTQTKTVTYIVALDSEEEAIDYATTLLYIFKGLQIEIKKRITILRKEDLQ